MPRRDKNIPARWNGMKIARKHKNESDMCYYRRQCWIMSTDPKRQFLKFDLFDMANSGLARGGRRGDLPRGSQGPEGLVIEDF